MDCNQLRQGIADYLEQCEQALIEIPLEWDADRISYACYSESQYETLRRMLMTWSASLVKEDYLTGRRTGLFMFKQPVLACGRKITYIELMDQRPTGKKQTAGFASLTIVPRYNRLVNAEFFAEVCKRFGFSVSRDVMKREPIWEVREVGRIIRIADLKVEDTLREEAVA